MSRIEVAGCEGSIRLRMCVDMDCSYLRGDGGCGVSVEPHGLTWNMMDLKLEHMACWIVMHVCAVVFC